MKVLAMNPSKLLAGLWLAAVTAAQAQNTTTFHECTPALCGGYAQNTATLSAQAITASPDPLRIGRLRLSIKDMVVKGTNQPAGNKPLEVYYGTFINRRFYVTLVGRITLNESGSFDDWLDFDFTALTDKTVYSANFYINDPSVPNTQFVSGWQVP
jgi:hypothetical protein